MARRVTYNLLDDLAGGMQVDEALVHLELIAIPSLRTFTTGLQNDEHLQETLYMMDLTVLRVVILRTLVGRRTGPLTRSCLSLARLMRSVETVNQSAKRKSSNL